MKRKSGTLTYIIGAGASYNAIPIVEEFKNTQFSGTFLSQFRSPYLRSYYNKFIEIIGVKLPVEYSIDTYIKKQKLARNEKAYYEALLFLDLFLIFKHIFDYEYKDPNDSNRLRKLNILDNRYDSLYASILKEENGVLYFPKNLNIISWNYDLMLELALNFLPGNLNDKINLLNSSGDLKGLNVCRLNGNINRSKETLDLFDKCLATTDGQAKERYYKEYLQFRIAEFENNNFKDESLDKIKFAWDYISTQVERAKKMIQETENLVVIGYSFPTYNRLIDKKILDSLDGQNIENIYIQDIPSNYDVISSKFLSLTDTQLAKKIPGNTKIAGVQQYSDIKVNTQSLLSATSGVGEFFIPPTWNPEY